MKRIDINNKGKYPFTVREDDRVNSCHTVEIEGPCKIYHKDGKTWAETEATVYKLVNIPTENIDFNKIGDIIDISKDE
jgi:hypothetical protein